MLDIIGVGLGPFNLSLNALIQKTNLSSVFLERKSNYDWHDGMLLDNGYLQIHFLKDLVSLTDPVIHNVFWRNTHEPYKKTNY